MILEIKKITMHQVDKVSLDPNADYSQILPIQQKRTIAFINHFVLNTVSFLNNFIQSCESRLMEFEQKLQNVEASLRILESQLSSIPGLEEEVHNKPMTVEEIIPDILSSNEEGKDNNIENANNSSDYTDNGGLICSEDSRFKKFFKMLSVGVPEAAVKLKMQTEGLDPNILDTPGAVIPGGGNQTQTEIE